jgi:hypothetical protein
MTSGNNTLYIEPKTYKVSIKKEAKLLHVKMSSWMAQLRLCHRRRRRRLQLTSLDYCCFCYNEYLLPSESHRDKYSHFNKNENRGIPFQGSICHRSSGAMTSCGIPSATDIDEYENRKENDDILNVSSHCRNKVVVNLFATSTNCTMAPEKFDIDGVLPSSPTSTTVIAPINNDATKPTKNDKSLPGCQFQPLKSW